MPISRLLKLRRISSCQARQTELALGGVQSCADELTLTASSDWRSPALAWPANATAMTIASVMRFMVVSFVG